MPSESGRKPKLPARGLAFKAVGLTISNRRRSATLLLVEAQLFAERPIRRPLGAQALDEIDRPNLPLRRTRSDTTAQRLVWALYGDLTAQRCDASNAATPQKLRHAPSGSEVAAAKQIAVANPTP
jgi:hypothetical protein